MLHYHVSCYQSKKIVAVEDDCNMESFTEKMKTTFKLPEMTVPIMQVYNEEWEDWIDFDENMPPSKSKIQLLVQENNVVEQQQDEEEIFQAPTPENPVNRCASGSDLTDWHLNYTLPTMPADVRNLLKEDSRIVLERKWRSRIVKKLYEDVSQRTMYPTPSQYKLVCSTLVARFPLLKDRAQNSSGYDTWKESLINKFKHERSPLQDKQMLKKREIYGHKKTAAEPNQPPSPVKRVKRDSIETNQPGEDAVSMQQHTRDLKQLAARRNPDVALVKDKMERTRQYRMEFIAQHSVTEILQEFPILKNETQLLGELQAAFGGKDVHASLCKFFLDVADGIMALAQKNNNCSDIIDSFTALLEECTSEKQKQGLTVDACSLLLPILLGEKEQMYVINKDPVVPTPCMIIHGNPLDTKDLHISMDGEVIASCTRISMGFAATFASFYVYATQYPRNGKNTLLLYQHQFAGLGNNKALPPKVLRLLNNLQK